MKKIRNIERYFSRLVKISFSHLASITYCTGINIESLSKKIMKSKDMRCKKCIENSITNPHGLTRVRVNTTALIHISFPFSSHPLLQMICFIFLRCTLTQSEILKHHKPTHTHTLTDKHY